MLMNPTSDFPSQEALAIDGAIMSGHAHDAVPLKLAIVYDSVPAGRRAMAVAKRMLEESGDTTGCAPSVWRFDLLDEPRCREHATIDAVAADLLILATEKPDALPTTVENWVSDFLARRRGTPVTILAMWGLEDEWTISLYERNQHGRMQPITSSAYSFAHEPARSAHQASPFDAAVAAA
jgi:hypothetical protein